MAAIFHGQEIFEEMFNESAHLFLFCFNERFREENTGLSWVILMC